MDNMQYFAKGGGCFLAGTRIKTPDGEVDIKDLLPGDVVISYNETTDIEEISRIGTIKKIQSDHFISINGHTYTTAEHPFYTLRGIVKVKDLTLSDKLLLESGRGFAEEVSSIVWHNAKAIVYNLLDVEPNNNYYANGYLVHNKGGGGRGGGASSRGSSGSSKSKSGSSSSSSSKPSAPPKGKSTATPGTKIKTADGKEVQTSVKKPSNTKFSNTKGIVGDNGYQPRFANNYSAPAGSVVYAQNNNFSDYLFWAYLFNSNNQARPENQQAVIVQPDNKEVQAKPVTEGVDGMAILNWVILISIVIAVVGGIIWSVNKLTTKEVSSGGGW